MPSDIREKKNFIRKCIFASCVLCVTLQTQCFAKIRVQLRACQKHKNYSLRNLKRSRLQQLSSMAQEKVLQRFQQLLLIFQALTVCSVCSEHVSLQTEPSTRPLRSESNISFLILHSSTLPTMQSVDLAALRAVCEQYSMLALLRFKPSLFHHCFLMNTGLGNICSCLIKLLPRGLPANQPCIAILNYTWTALLRCQWLYRY